MSRRVQASGWSAVEDRWNQRFVGRGYDSVLEAAEDVLRSVQAGLSVRLMIQGKGGRVMAAVCPTMLPDVFRVRLRGGRRLVYRVLAFRPGGNEIVMAQ